jgi:hypothetical protein
MSETSWNAFVQIEWDCGPPASEKLFLLPLFRVRRAWGDIVRGLVLEMLESGPNFSRQRVFYTSTIQDSLIHVGGTILSINESSNILRLFKDCIVFLWKDTAK